MDDAVLDYPLVEERDKIADKFAREDKAPQPAVTQYRGLATVEMAVPTGVIPPRVMVWWSWNQKRDASTSSVVIWRICVILSSAIVNMAICDKTAAPQSILPVVA